MSSTSVKEINFDGLPPYEKRSFISEKANLSNREEVISLYNQLLEHSIDSAEDLEKWLKNRSELEAALDQEGSVLYIRMSCQTDDQKKADAYKSFIENIVPAIKPLDDQLDRKYLEEKGRFPLDRKRYEVYDRAVKADVDLFVEKNVPLQTQVQLLCQDYQTLCGAMTVMFKEEERTLPQMTKYLMDTDRSLRESAWRACAKRRLQEKERLAELFDKMLALRSQIATNAGCKNFTEYQFRRYHRFDYTPEDCQQYHQAIENVAVPLWKEIIEKRRQAMQFESLRPWDTMVDPLGRGALKPFDKVEDLIGGVHEIFKKVHPELGQQFGEMANLGLLDLASRKGKAPGGYHSAIAEARKSFIFMNAVGVDYDVRTLLHEGGHAFHSSAAAAHPLFSYRHAPMEFCEVASMAMELLGGEHLSVFYSEDDNKRSQQVHLEDVIHTLIWVAIIDAFQHWIYQNPDHTPEARREAWLEIYDRFGGNFVDWTGLSEEEAYLWHKQLHVFEAPFYYIEYGIAQLGALQLWAESKKDKKSALEHYRKGLALGGSRPLPEIFAAAGLKFDFSEKTITPLVDLIKKELN